MLEVLAGHVRAISAAQGHIADTLLTVTGRCTGMESRDELIIECFPQQVDDELANTAWAKEVSSDVRLQN